MAGIRKVRSNGSGFTLVELMMTIAVLGILVAVAVPLYNDYQTRARVAQVLTTIDTLRTVFHTEYETEGKIPKFSAGKEGEIPPELAKLPIGPELLQFDYLAEHLIQSSHHYGPFDGKDIPYLMLVARDTTQSRYLKAVAHALPHSAYAWIIEPMAMVVPLLDAETRHASHAPSQPPPVSTQPTSVSSNPPPQATAQPQQPTSCASGEEKVTIPAGMSPSGSAFDVCTKACGPGELRDANNPLSCVAPAPTSQGSSQPAATSQIASAASGGTTQGGGTAQQGSTRSSAPSAQQQYDDCVAHVMANHPHGHAWGLLQQCNRQYPH
jgi:prepilin-type N-terminal cleavage/methylation domain-containing protein